MWYTWTAVPDDPGAVPPAMGISDGEHAAMTAAGAAALRAGTCQAHVEEVTGGTDARSALRCYIGTGRAWRGQLTVHGVFAWFPVITRRGPGEYS